MELAHEYFWFDNSTSGDVVLNGGGDFDDTTKQNNLSLGGFGHNLRRNATFSTTDIDAYLRPVVMDQSVEVGVGLDTFKNSGIYASIFGGAASGDSRVAILRGIRSEEGGTASNYYNQNSVGELALGDSGLSSHISGVLENEIMFNRESGVEGVDNYTLNGDTNVGSKIEEYLNIDTIKRGVVNYWGNKSLRDTLNAREATRLRH